MSFIDSFRRLNDDAQWEVRYDDDQTNYTVTNLFYAIATGLFVVLALQLLFPVNNILPIDRRTSSVTCATLVYVSHKFLLKQDQPVDLIEAVDFDVLLLLSAIMVINFVVLRLKETNRTVKYVQDLIKENPVKGFWVVSLFAFIVSPFLTNDGVCLLFVAPILVAFESINEDSTVTGVITISENMQLKKTDAVYFMLTLACSANIGSALTYTGNPQNMIVAQDALSVMSPMKFLGYMALPAVFSFLISTYYIQYCWLSDRKSQELMEEDPNLGVQRLFPGVMLFARYGENKRQPLAKQSDKGSKRVPREEDLEDLEESLYEEAMGTPKSSHSKISLRDPASPLQEEDPALSVALCGYEQTLPSNATTALSPFSPQRAKIAGGTRVIGSERFDIDDSSELSAAEQAVQIITSPAPYIILILLALMIVMIFVDVMAISGLICVTAIIMVLTLVVGNHLKQDVIWSRNKVELDEESEGSQSASAHGTTSPKELVSSEERAEKLDQFFEALFDSIDYNLLFIFLGLFIVVSNLEATGLPKKVWDSIVGATPFETGPSVIGISLFVMFASQFLGNVAVCQLAKPNVENLDEDAKRYAWALISFVSTVAGNLTLTGSAANIIVAEKANRIDRDSSLDFFRHFKVCFVVCFFSCGVGALLITAANEIEKAAQ